MKIKFFNPEDGWTGPEEIIFFKVCIIMIGILLIGFGWVISILW